MLKLEPMGSTHFSSDKIWDEKGQTMISDIYVTFNENGIKSIQFIYFHEGAHVESQKHGYSGGQHIKRVRLEKDEYVTALSGVVHLGGKITSLTFHTNKRKHGPFCKRYEYLNKREIDVGIRDRSEFGGLFGSFSEFTYGGYLTSIGMYVSHNASSIDAVPRTMFGATYDHQFIRLQSLDSTTPRLDYQSPKIVNGFPAKFSRPYLSFMTMEAIRMGPIGTRTSGVSFGQKIEWDEMGNNVISHITVSFDTMGVRSIQFGYVNNGALAISKIYGLSSVGYSSRIVRLNHESEFVTGLSMEILDDNITSLTFHTNQRKHEVVNLTTSSNSKLKRRPQKIELHSGILERGEFGGFFGTHGIFSLISIGLYVRLVLPDVKMIKEEKL